MSYYNYRLLHQIALNPWRCCLLCWLCIKSSAISGYLSFCIFVLLRDLNLFRIIKPVILKLYQWSCRKDVMLRLFISAKTNIEMNNEMFSEEERLLILVHLTLLPVSLIISSLFIGHYQIANIIMFKSSF